MYGGRLAAEAVDVFLRTGDAHALAMARKRFMKTHGRVFWILRMMQWFWYSSDTRRERFVSICKDPDVQRLTWDAYVDKIACAGQAGGTREDILQGYGPSSWLGAAMRLAEPGMWKPVAIAALAALIVAALGATVTDLGPWYQSLDKPDWQPPDWLFGPAWTLIFALTALSAALAWRDAPNRSVRDWVIVLFSLNGLLNILWSLLFFRLRRPDWALIEVVLLWLSILPPIFVLARFSKGASALLLPYLAWVTFAGVLNLAVVKLNGPFASALGSAL